MRELVQLTVTVGDQSREYKRLSQQVEPASRGVGSVGYLSDGDSDAGNCGGFIETYQRDGTYPMRFPYVPGAEGAGIIEVLGYLTPPLPAAELDNWIAQRGAQEAQALTPAVVGDN